MKIRLLAVLLFFSCTSHQKLCPSGNISGHYRLAFYPQVHSRSGWDVDLRQLEELLTLKDDSTYLIERIRPQGGFELLPRTGQWKIKDCVLLLKDESATRYFIFEKDGLREPRCARKDLRKVTWKKE